MKSTKRAYRRVQLAKKKKQARKIYPYDKDAKQANHIQNCSCYMCGNPRKHFKELTMQERRANDSTDFDLND